MALSEQQRIVLERLAELVVPADDFPSAAGGAVGFLERVLAEDRPDWLPRVVRALAVAEAATGLEGVLADGDGAWLVRMVAQGYYAGPAAWGMVGWRTGEFAPVQTELSSV